MPVDPEVEAQLKRGRVFPPFPPNPNRVQANVEAKMRQFDTGATRHTDEGKLDYEGFLSPLVLQGFAEYMHANRVQADGQLRASDNWQKGIPTDAYMKSLLRHTTTAWLIHRGYEPARAAVVGEAERDLKEALYGVMFNAMGYLHELLKENR